MRILGAITLILLTACSNPINVGDEASLLSQNEIDAQKVIWTANRAGAGYTIEVYRECFCVRPSDYFYNYRVSTNSSDARILIEAIDDQGNTLSVLPDNPAYYPNLEQIFVYMETELDAGRSVFGTFHASEGYPIVIELGLEETYRIEVTGYF